MNGQMEESLKVNGKITKWKAMEFLLGPMVEDMKENILTTRKKEMECFTGM